MKLALLGVAIATVIGKQSVVYRVDPATARVVGTFPAGPGAFLALGAYGSMWVTSYAGSDV